MPFFCKIVNFKMTFYRKFVNFRISSLKARKKVISAEMTFEFLYDIVLYRIHGYLRTVFEAEFVEHA